MVPLESLANGGNRASVVSADGSVIAGFAQGSFSRTPAVWDGTTLSGELLDPPNGDALGEITGIRDDGSVLLGVWDGDATQWTNDGGTWVRDADWERIVLARLHGLSGRHCGYGSHRGF